MSRRLVSRTIALLLAVARVSQAPHLLLSPLFLGLLAAAIFVVLGHSLTLAATRVVAGNCASPCTTGTSCHPTLANALSQSNSGDVILVCPNNSNLPYYSQFSISNTRKRLTIKAVGDVTIDGTENYTGEQLWTRLGITNVWLAQVSMHNPKKENQLFVDNVRKTYIAPPAGGFGDINPGYFSYDTLGTPDTIYVNIGGDNPGDYHDTFIGDRLYGISVLNSDSITVDGFKTRRTVENGIYVRGDGDSLDIKANTVLNCIATENAKRGIHLRNCVGCKLEANTTHTNAHHGIYLTVDSSTTLLRNISYSNNDPYKPGILGDAAGFKIGDNGAAYDVRYTTLDYNVAYDNEDSGFNVKGALRTLLRRNQSYNNGDHGFDTLVSDSTVLLNNVSARNHHDGISVENDAHHVVVFNNILWHNAVNPSTLEAGSDPRARELFFGDSTKSTSDHNIVCGLAPGDVGGGYSRWLVEFEDDISARYQSWSSYRAARPAFDAKSFPSDPLFVDSTTANFRIGSVASDALDAAKTDVAGWLSPFWLSTDPLGFGPHDTDDAAAPDSGVGAIAYADIGLYEWDGIRPARILSLSSDMVGAGSVHLVWTASGNDSLFGTASAADLRYALTTIGSDEAFGSATPASPQPVPASGLTSQGAWVSGLGYCIQYYFSLKFVDGRAQWSGLGNSAGAISGPTLHNGQWACDEGMRTGDVFAAIGQRGDAGVDAGRSNGVALSGTGGNSMSVEVVPGENELELKVVALRAQERAAYGDESSSGVVYQEPDGAGGWVTKLHYELPGDNGWAIVAPSHPRRWILLEPLATRAVMSELVANGTRWLVSQTRHSRLGGEAAELEPGDTLTVRYVGEAAEDALSPNWLVVFARPESDAASSRAGVNEREQATLPTVFGLHQNHPNPFAVATTLRFDLPRPEAVRLEVFDLMGRRVAVLRNAWMPAGRYTLDWNGRDSGGSRVRPGAYLCRMAAGSFRTQRKMVVLP